MKIKTKEEMDVLMEKLREQIEMFTMEMQYEIAVLKFRETYEAWYDERITLDECLEAMLDNMKLCKRIGVWSD